MKINKRSYAKLKANEIPEKKPYTRAKHLNKQHVVPGCPYNIVFRQGKQNQKLWSLIISLDSCRVGPKKDKPAIFIVMAVMKMAATIFGLARAFYIN